MTLALDIPLSLIDTCGGRKGTYAGAQWHRKYGIEICDPCREAAAAYQRDYRRKRRHGLHSHLLPEWLVKQLVDAAPGPLKKTAIRVIACCKCCDTECVDEWNHPA